MNTTDDLTPEPGELRVLHVEDNELDAELVARAMRKGGFTGPVVVVQAEAEFERQLRLHRPDVVLADYNLPQWKGMEALDVLRREGLDIPLILVSGALGDVTAVECIKRGATDYVLKDGLARLPEAVRRALQEKSLRGQQERSDAALRESQAQLEALVHSASDAIVGKTLNGTITAWNPGAEKLFGYSSSEALGESLRMLLPDVRADEESDILARIVRGESVEHFETVRVRKDGKNVDVSVTISPIRDSSGAIVGASKIARDITARKRAEKKLAEKMEELARSNAELEQFAYIASHDLQEPLRMVAAYTQLLAERYRGWLDADAEQFISYASEGALRMQALIQDLLAFSRVGRNCAACVPVDCEAALEEVLLTLGPAMQESGAVVTHAALPVVWANRSHLTQVFQNLIGNAIKFRGKEPPAISVQAEKAGPQWLFSVSDSGIGIAPEQAGNIFVVFQRLHTRTEYPGNGIGLAICKKIIEHCGGKIWVEARAGPGSVFKFTMPCEGPAEGKLGSPENQDIAVI